jgi:hypothetical protein
MIDQIGTELGGFLTTTESKRNAESNALANAEQFVTRMKGEFFHEIAVGTQGTDPLSANDFNDYLIK